MKMYVLYALLCGFLLVPFSNAGTVSRSGAELTAKQWMKSNSAFRFAVENASGSNPVIADVYPLSLGTNKFGAWHVQLHPRGYIILSPDTKMTPVIAFSITSDFISEDSKNNALLDILKRDVSANIELIRSSNFLALVDSDSDLKTKVTHNQALWDALIDGSNLIINTPSDALVTNVAPMLSTAWNQTRYFNDYMPACSPSSPSYNDHAPAGCGSIAACQIFKYYNWPLRGTGTQTYYDDSTLRTTSLYHDYDWNSMLTNYIYSSTYPASNVSAIATFIRDVGYGMEMDYGCTLSASYNQSYADAANLFFYYKQCTSRSWNETTACNDISAGRPLQISYDESSGHMLVADGFAQDGSTVYLHINYGWGGYQDGWYRPSSLYGSASIDYMTPGVEPLYKPIIVNTNSTIKQTSFDVHWSIPDIYSNDATAFDLFEGTPATSNTTFRENADNFDKWWNNESGWKIVGGQFFYCATNAHQGYIQTILPVIPSSTSILRYSYRRSLAAVNYVYIEVSSDLGKTWRVIHAFTGQVFDANPRIASASLGAYANTPIYLRIRFRHSRGVWGWYGEYASSSGFFIDNIEVTSCKEMDMSLVSSNLPPQTRSFTITNKYGGTYYHMLNVRDSLSVDHSAPFICKTTVDLELFSFKAFALTNNTVLRWEKPIPCGLPNNTVMVRRTTSDYPAVISEGALVYEGTNSVHMDTGLTPGVTYYYTIWLNDGSSWIVPP